jgi:hypothetical protein
MTTQRSRLLQPGLRVRCDAGQSGLEATLAQADGRAVRGRQDGQTGPPAVWLPAAPTRSTKSPGQTQPMRTQNARTPTRDTGLPHRTLDSGRMDIACADTGRSHRTPDSGRVDATEERTGRPRHGSIRIDILDTTTTRLSTGRRTVDLWTAPAALGNDDGSEAPARSLRRPSRALAHCCPQTISGRE